jgi:hypothetical protein
LKASLYLQLFVKPIVYSILISECSQIHLETEKKTWRERGTARDRGRREGEEWDKRGKK